MLLFPIKAPRRADASLQKIEGLPEQWQLVHEYPAVGSIRLAPGIQQAEVAHRRVDLQIQCQCQPVPPARSEELFFPRLIHPSKRSTSQELHNRTHHQAGIYTVLYQW